MKIRKLSKDDIQQILKLDKDNTPNEPIYSRYDRKSLQFIFNNPEQCGAIGIFDGNNLIGWVSYRTGWKRHKKEKGLYEISSIAIDKKYRRKGLGMKLVNKTINILKKKNIKKIFVTISPLNIEALLLFLKRGFVIFNFRKDVYGTNADRVYLELKL